MSVVRIKSLQSFRTDTVLVWTMQLHFSDIFCHFYDFWLSYEQSFFTLGLFVLHVEASHSNSKVTCINGSGCTTSNHTSRQCFVCIAQRSGQCSGAVSSTPPSTVILIVAFTSQHASINHIIQHAKTTTHSFSTLPSQASCGWSLPGDRRFSTPATTCTITIT